MYEQIALNRRKTIFLMVVFCGLLIAIGWSLAIYFDSTLILFWAVILSIAMSWWSYFRGDKTILAIAKAKLIEPQQNLTHRKILHLVENLCITAGLTMPKIYIINDSAPNAFATGRNPQHASIAITSGLVEKLDKVELEGVIAHELSHIKNYDILLATVVITLLGIVVLASDWMLRPRYVIRHNRNNANGAMILIGLLLAILSPILTKLIYFAISRKREYLADAGAALLTRYPEGLANALTKIDLDKRQLRFISRATASLYIVNPFKNTNINVAGLFSTHPPLEKRIQALNNMNLAKN